MDWRAFLTGRRVREDLYHSFPPEDLDDYQPALLNEGSVLSAARVAARLLQVVAKRGGSRVDATAIERLISILDEAMPDSATPQCDDEAARILDWLETAEQVPPDERDHATLPPELDLMLGAGIEDRISVAKFAIEQGHNLELEYFEESDSTWPRFRCEPIEVLDEPDDAPAGDGQRDDEGEDGAEDETEEVGAPILRVERRGEQLDLPVRNIRWLMPVTRDAETDDEAMREQLGKVLDFPGPDDDEG
jgi:hypothetical protein